MCIGIMQILFNWKVLTALEAETTLFIIDIKMSDLTIPNIRLGFAW